MKVTAVKTAIVREEGNASAFLLESLENAKKSLGEHPLEGCIIIVSAKIISILEGNMVNLDDISFEDLVKSEADEVISDTNGCFLTRKYGIIIPNAGIDRSNAPKGHAVMWPSNPQVTADSLCNTLREKFGLKDVGVVIADSRITPGRKGTTGVALAWSGFEGIQDERGKVDLFGGTLKLAQKATADNLVTAALIVMGEADECTPIAIIEDAPVEFIDRKISNDEGVMHPKFDLF